MDVPRDIAGLADRIEASRTAWAEASPGTLVVAATEAPERFLGDIGWRWSLHEKFAAADLGYSIHPDARGRGVGRRAIVALTRWLLAPDGRGLDRVQLDHSTENPASCRVALAAGFEREGVRRGYLPLREPDGTVRRHDVCLHGTIEPPPDGPLVRARSRRAHTAAMPSSSQWLRLRGGLAGLHPGARARACCSCSAAR